MKKFILTALISLSSLTFVEAQSMPSLTNYEFTNYVESQGSKFRMWVPPTCQKVKGVVVAFTQMQEVVSLDKNLREACLLEDLAIVWASQLGENDYPKLEAGLKALADASGMPEVADAPFATIAHSTAGIFCRTIASQKPEKCFAIVQLSAVDYRDNKLLSEIPWMTIKNGAEETDDTWEEARYFLVNDKEAYKRPDGSSSGDDKSWESPRGNGCRITLVSVADGGHFGWSPMESKLVATFIEKAAHYQIGEPGTPLKRIAENDGWLTDTTFETTPDYKPAKYDDYAGDPSKAFWHLDEEMALLWSDLHITEWSKQPQSVMQSVFDSGVWTNSTKRMDLSKGGIDSRYPTDATSSVSGNPVKVKLYNGIYKIEDEKDLYYSAARYGFNGTKDWITFYQEGTSEYRYAETTTAQVEAINFPASTSFDVTSINDQKINVGNVAYNVSGDADNYIVSGNVTLTNEGWAIDNFTSVPTAQVYVRHAGGNHNNIKETKFNISNDRLPQSVSFGNDVPDKIAAGKSSTIKLNANSTGKDAYIDYILLSGPASLNGSDLITTGKEGTIRLLAIAHNDVNNPAKAIKEITVAEDSAVGEVISDFNVVCTISNNFVELQNLKDGSDISLIDINGHTVLHFISRENKLEISLENTSRGIYFLTIDGRCVSKIIRK